MPSRVNTGVSATASNRRQQNFPVRIINYGAASDLEIWEVARAASAAPFYFKPHEVKKNNVKRIVLTDGGVGPTINPTREGILDIEEETGRSSVNIVVSIGTAKKLHPQATQIIPQVKAIIDRAADPGAVHGQVLQMKREIDFEYFRLDDPGALDMELDEWKPRPRMGRERSGGKTIERIEAAFYKWAQKGKSQGDLRACANYLVACRRRRALSASKWERFATASQFVCNTENCQEDVFYDRDMFQSHLADHHHYPNSRIQEKVRECRQEWQYPPPRT